MVPRGGFEQVESRHANDSMGEGVQW